MIQVKDKLKYLPIDKNSIIDTNELLNLAYKEMVDRIKNKSKQINVGSSNVIVTITGTVNKAKSKGSFELIVDCDDENIADMVHKKLIE